MKAGLKRIEATLHNLENHNTVADGESNSSVKPSFSFRISANPTESTENQKTPSQQAPTQPEENLLFHQTCVDVAEDHNSDSPSLPKFKTPSFGSHHNAPNPALATNLLQEIQQIVSGWQAELKKTIRQIQDVYLEGPIVNGWLESHERQPEQPGAATLRHAEVDHLMNYVEEICAQKGKASDQSARAGYRLCGLDDSGQLWSRPCPADQVPSVSMGIARYQKLRQLLGRKQYLETRLGQLAETLVVLHGHIKNGVKV